MTRSMLTFTLAIDVDTADLDAHGSNLLWPDGTTPSDVVLQSVAETLALIVRDLLDRLDVPSLSNPVAACQRAALDPLGEF